MSRSAALPDALAAWRDEQSVRDLVQTTAARLDAEDFAGWLALFDETAIYEISSYSPEIRRTMTWWTSDRPALEKILREIPQHEREPARRLRLLGPVSVLLDGDRAQAEVAFAVYRTLPDGETRLYVVGRYASSLIRKSETWLYIEHRVLLETRLLESFTHLPL